MQKFNEVRNKTIKKKTMKPKLNKNLSLPWTPQGEKARGNNQILLPGEKATAA